MGMDFVIKVSSLSLFLCSLAAMKGAVFFCHDVLPPYRPKSTWPKQPWTETSETMSQNKPFLLLSGVSWVF
jgi:hypothetical protein